MEHKRYCDKARLSEEAVLLPAQEAIGSVAVVGKNWQAQVLCWIRSVFCDAMTLMQFRTIDYSWWQNWTKAGSAESFVNFIGRCRSERSLVWSLLDSIFVLCAAFSYSSRGTEGFDCSRDLIKQTLQIVRERGEYTIKRYSTRFSCISFSIS